MTASTSTERARRRCTACTAFLARDNRSELCGPCTRKGLALPAADDGPDTAPEYPLAFWSRPDLADALASEQIGRVIYEYRLAHRPVLPQATVARWLGVHQSRVSKLERNRPMVTDLVLLAQMCEALGVPRELWWFRPPRPAGPGRRAPGAARGVFALRAPGHGRRRGHRHGHPHRAESRMTPTASGSASASGRCR